MKRKYKLHTMAKDCPLCGGAFYLGESCEVCGFGWQAWQNKPKVRLVKPTSAAEPGVSSDKGEVKNEQ